MSFLLEEKEKSHNNHPVQLWQCAGIAIKLNLGGQQARQGK